VVVFWRFQIPCSSASLFFKFKPKALLPSSTLADSPSGTAIRRKACQVFLGFSNRQNSGVSGRRPQLSSAGMKTGKKGQLNRSAPPSSFFQTVPRKLPIEHPEAILRNGLAASAFERTSNELEKFGSPFGLT
jgi:hypothetical protein